MGISYVAVVLPRPTQGKCLKDNREVTLKVALENLLGDLASRKEGGNNEKIGNMSREKSGLVLKSHSKRIEQDPASLDINLLIEGTRSECLHRLVRELELEARGRRRRRDQGEHA